MGAEGDFTDILGIFNVPDLWHAAAGPGLRDRKEKIQSKGEKENKVNQTLNLIILSILSKLKGSSWLSVIENDLNQDVKENNLPPAGGANTLQ